MAAGWKFNSGTDRNLPELINTVTDQWGMKAEMGPDSGGPSSRSTVSGGEPDICQLVK
jgi:hypothetical protein